MNDGKYGKTSLARADRVHTFDGLPEPPLIMNVTIDLSEPSLRRLSKGKVRRQPKRRQAALAGRKEEPSLPAVGTIARTKRLILAALRVWELKHGIRD